MAVQQTTSQVILPEWYTKYAQSLLGRALSASEEPYKKYTTYDASGKEVPIARIAGFQPEQEQAFSAFKSNLGAYQPYVSAAARGLEQGTQSFTAPGVAQQYMSPYIQQVVSGIGSTAARNLTENILPNINRTFVGGGTFGGSRSQEFMNRAVRDTQAAALAEQNKAMQAGYDTAANLYSTEQNRRVTAAPYMAAIGEQLQTQQQKDAAGLEMIGAQRQGLAQQSADLAYQDFLAQRDYPFTQLQKVASIGGTPSGTGSTTVNTAPGPSTLSQIGGVLGGAAGIIGATGGFGSGGWFTNLFKAEGGEISMDEARKKNSQAKAGLGWLKD